MPVQRPSKPVKPSAQSGERPRLRPANSGRRIRREKRTIAAMLSIYCRDHHANHGDPQQLCGDCSQLLRYAHQRLDNCVFGELKQPCNQCRVHCYSKQLRPRVVEVMRYAGPRMTLRYPLLSLLHLFDKLGSR
ncbi:MAG: nitrous oxide-stimulated promoter family protein [Halochromatium sp.]|nr:nitrous oxide-stimulated promoter family protein [Halochromatium sp.]